MQILLRTEAESVGQHSGQKHSGEDQERSHNEKTERVWKGRRTAVSISDVLDGKLYSKQAENLRHS